jgi:hypothetical protein
VPRTPRKAKKVLRVAKSSLSLSKQNCPPIRASAAHTTSIPSGSIKANAVKTGKADEIQVFFDPGNICPTFFSSTPYPIPIYLIAIPKQPRNFTPDKEKVTNDNLENESALGKPESFELLQGPTNDLEDPMTTTPGVELLLDSSTTQYLEQPTSGVILLPTNQPSTAHSLLRFQSVKCYVVELPLYDDIGTVVLQHTRSMNTIFKGYRRDAHGHQGHAESHQLFRAVGDQIVTVDGVHCVHTPFAHVLHLLQHPSSTEQTHKRILLCHCPSRNNTIST